MQDIKYLVFSGGGASACSLLGGLSMLFTQFPREKIEGAAGVSSGAILAMLILIGMDPIRLKQESKNLLNALKASPLSLLTLVGKGGLMESPLRGILSGLLQEAGIEETETLKGFLEKTGKVLKVGVFESSRGNFVLLCPHTTPRANLLDSVLASSSLPFLFPPVRVRGLHSNYLFLDGAVLCNFPFQAFPAHHTLGFWLTSPSLPPALPASPPPSSPLLQVISSTMQAMFARLSFSERSFFSKNDRIVPFSLDAFISGLDYSAINEDFIDYLFNKGTFECFLWLQTKSPEHFASLLFSLLSCISLSEKEVRDILAYIKERGSLLHPL